MIFICACYLVEIPIGIDSYKCKPFTVQMKPKIKRETYFHYINKTLWDKSYIFKSVWELLFPIP